MSEIAATSNRSGHRYNWCPSCDELWVVARMAASGVDRCPICDGPVLPYIGRSPYDTGRSGTTDGTNPPRPRNDRDPFLTSRRRTA